MDRTVRLRGCPGRTEGHRGLPFAWSVCPMHATARDALRGKGHDAQQPGRGPEFSYRRPSVAPLRTPYRLGDRLDTAQFSLVFEIGGGLELVGAVDSLRVFRPSDQALPPSPSKTLLRRRSDSLAVAVATEQTREVSPRACPEFIGVDVYPVVAARSLRSAAVNAATAETEGLGVPSARHKPKKRS